MSEKEKNNFINKNIQYQKTSSIKTGYSNSRLSVPIWDTPQPKLSFDAMTIVGNLNKNNAQKLSEFMSFEHKLDFGIYYKRNLKLKLYKKKYILNMTK